tara:strand:- start:4134 stop:5942 length:1809 start_codon:yes stop_codon:yes gene_type:complete
MDLNSSEDDDEDVNDDCIILGVCKTSALRKRRRRKRLTPNPKRHKTVPVPVPLPPAASPQQKRVYNNEDRESDAAASNSESDHEDDTKESRAYRRVIRRNREAVPSQKERVAFDALPDHEQFAFIPKRRRTAPHRFHIKTNRGTVGNLHRSYDEPHAEDTDPVEGWGAVRSEFGGSPKSTSSWNDTDDDHVEIEEPPKEPKKEPPKEPKKEPPKEPNKAPKKETPKEPPKEPNKAMRSPPEVVYTALLVQPDGKIGITIPRFTLPDGRATRQAQVSWIPVRYLEMLLFSRYDGATTGVIFKTLQRMGLGPTSWIISPAAVKRGEISQDNADFIIRTFRELLPSNSLLNSRAHVVSLIPVVSAVTICRDRGVSLESVAFLRAFAPREVSFLTAPPAPPQPAPPQPADDDADDDDDDENTPLSKRTKRTERTKPPVVKKGAVARASWRVVKTPTQTLTSTSLTSATIGTIVESDQDSNATIPYGLASPPSLDELVPYDTHAPRAPPSSTTTAPPRPHSLNWERRSALDLAEAARRELEAQTRRVPTNRHFYKFKSSQPCRYGPDCRFRYEGCAFVHSGQRNPNDWVERDVRGNLLPPFHESDRF